MQKYYEIVIFSNENTYSISEFINKIDPKRMNLIWHFGNEFMVKKKKNYVKDLSYLNRKLKNIVVIDSFKEDVF